LCGLIFGDLGLTSVFDGYIIIVYHNNNKDIKMEKRNCLRCGHTWNKRLDSEPVLCPKCKSPYWDKPRKKDTKNEKL